MTGEVPQPYRISQPNNTGFKQCGVPVVSKVTRAAGEIGVRVVSALVMFFVLQASIGPSGISESNAPRSSEKSRERSNSVSLAETQTTRKRSSSGVFKIEEVTPPKKAELINESDETQNTSELVSNGRRKHKDCTKETDKRKETATDKRKETIDKRKETTEKKKETPEKRTETTEKKKETTEKRKEMNNVIERFDSDKKVECVTAFKEIDNWD